MAAEPQQSETRAVLALLVGLFSICPGVFIGISAGLFARGGLFMLQFGEASIGLPMTLGGLVIAFGLPALTLWLAGPTKRRSSVGFVAWILGWTAIVLITASLVGLYLISEVGPIRR